MRCTLAPPGESCAVAMWPYVKLLLPLLNCYYQLLDSWHKAATSVLSGISWWTKMDQVLSMSDFPSLKPAGQPDNLSSA